ncbi:hypothetical protein ACDZ29_15040 [Peribacillus sp. RS7]|nr:hypothetical protein [Peribacillus sp. ACCC06369]
MSDDPQSSPPGKNKNTSITNEGVKYGIYAYIAWKTNTNSRKWLNDKYIA